MFHTNATFVISTFSLIEIDTLKKIEKKTEKNKYKKKKTK